MYNMASVLSLLIYKLNKNLRGHKNPKILGILMFFILISLVLTAPRDLKKLRFF